MALIILVTIITMAIFIKKTTNTLRLKSITAKSKGN